MRDGISATPYCCVVLAIICVLQILHIRELRIENVRYAAELVVAQSIAAQTLRTLETQNIAVKILRHKMGADTNSGSPSYGWNPRAFAFTNAIPRPER